MPVIELDQHLIDELASLDEAKATQLEQVVHEAMRQHLFRLRQDKIARERRYYEEYYQEIARQHLGQYVAIHNGVVVGADQNGHELARRIRRQYGRIPVAIIQVSPMPDPPTVFARSPRLETV
jgi:hypothetical protein